ncbi:MAG TPA: lysine--tRNA ligase [Fusobacteria bacterium]|nr:lysine--tRNA ligase [Fusobacteriota bacterium]|tara:strand:+ start:1042 stop:2490 length:1449 start_codon:yes stop_codon:yes gene_type:complete
MDQQTKELEKIIRDKLDKLDKIREKGIYPFGRNFDKKDDLGSLTKEGLSVKSAGRIMSYRRQGKASFGHIEDASGRIQYYIKRDDVGEDVYDVYKLLSVGDFVGLEGDTFYTNTGELTIRISKLYVLSKNLRPLPEKYHGLKDVETRYRHRYVDLIMNRDVKDTFRKRSQIVTLMREYLVGRGFIEVETPMMHPIPGGALAKPFVTYHESLDMELYLRIAPELYLKKLIVGGYEKIFEINRNFRNEGISTRHNPEFTSMELYEAYADYKNMMDITEDMISEIVKKICKDYKVTYGDSQINFAKPWRRVSMMEAVKEYAGIDFNGISREKAVEAAKSLGISGCENHSANKIMNTIFEEKVESKLIQPTFVYGYPKEVSPLAKRNEDNPELADRFELFVYGRELANAYSELNDPIEQEENFKDQLTQREEDDEAHRMDDDFVLALEYGMPPTGGLGIGIDRLVMFLTNSQSIRDVIFFPQMRNK